MGNNIERNKKRNVLMIAEGTIPSVMLCGKFQLEYLDKEGLINFRYSLIYWVSAKLLNWAEIVIFVRPALNFELECIKKLKAAGKKVIIVMDDDLLNVPENMFSSDHFKAGHDSILEMISLSDMFLSPNRNLIEKYGKMSENCALIEEPSMAFSKHKNQNEVIKIGFAGSIDRTDDLNTILSDVVERIVNRYRGRATFEFFGAKPEFVEKYGFRHIPYQDSYEKYCETMTTLNWDIGLAPMPITEFHKYKHYNKFIEYSSYGIVGVYTKCEPYTWVIREKENGLLCNNNSDEWFEAISMLIENHNLRERMADICETDANTSYSIEAVSKQYYKCIMSLEIGNSTNAEIVHSIFLRQFAFYIERLFVKTKKYGFNTPVVLAKKFAAGVFSNK